MVTMTAGRQLSGGIQQPNILGEFLAGRQARREVDKQNFLAQHAGALMDGDKDAMSQFAQYDPGAAMQIMHQTREEKRQQQTMELRRQEHEQSMSASRERLQLTREQNQREAERWALERDASEAAQMAEELDRVMASAHAAYKQGPEAFGALVRQNAAEMEEHGIDPAGVTYETFPVIMAGLIGQREGLSAALAQQKGPKPQSPEGKRQADIEAGLLDPSAATADTEADREIARLESIGIPREVAIRIKEGVYRTVTDPMTRETQVIDLSSGEPVYRVQQGAQGATGNVSTGNATGSPQDGARLSTAGTGSPDLTFGQPYSDAESAFGFEGAAKSAANTMTDAVGLGPAFPETLQTQRDFDVLREKLIADIANGYDRQPPSWLLRNIEDLTPKAGRPFQGPEDARSKLRAVGRDLQMEQTRIEGQLQSRAMSPTARQELETRLSGLHAALGRIQSAYQAFDEGDSNTTQSGVTWRLVE